MRHSYSSPPLAVPCCRALRARRISDVALLIAPASRSLILPQRHPQQIDRAAGPVRPSMPSGLPQSAQLHQAVEVQRRRRTPSAAGASRGRCRWPAAPRRHCGPFSASGPLLNFSGSPSWRVRNLLSFRTCVSIMRPRVFTFLHRVGARVGEARAQECQTQPDGARVLEIWIRDVFRVAKPCPQLGKTDVIRVDIMLAHHSV